MKINLNIQFTFLSPRINWAQRLSRSTTFTTFTRIQRFSFINLQKTHSKWAYVRRVTFKQSRGRVISWKSIKWVGSDLRWGWMFDLDFFNNRFNESLFLLLLTHEYVGVKLLSSKSYFFFFSFFFCNVPYKKKITNFPLLKTDNFCWLFIDLT